MLPRLATLAPLAAVLATLATAAEAAPAEVAATGETAPLPECSFHNAENATAIDLICFVGKRFRLRITHQPAASTADSRLVVVCEPHRIRKTDYEALFAMNLQLGETFNVVLHQCPLPEGQLGHFFKRMGVHGVGLLRVTSLSMLNDTMQADFLKDIDLQTLQLYDLTRIDLHDDFFASAGGLHNLTITGTNTRLPEGLLRHTPQLRKLHIWKLNASWIPTTFLHGLHNLTNLLASRNGLRNLTHEHFRDLGRLRRLDLYKNQLETLPEDVFASLAELEELRIECNPLHALPEQLFAGTPRLKLLRINGKLSVSTDVPSLPAGIFRGLSQLELLMLDRLGLHRLPAGIFRGLTALQNLSLAHNELMELPDDSFSELNGLLYLDLGRNQLRQLSPDLLRGLASMDTLFLNGNGLTELPIEMFTHTPSLQRLFLQKNNLTTLEKLTFSGLDESLHHLDLSNNNLQLDTQEPAFAFVRKMRNLDLHGNRIRRIPGEITYNLLDLERVDLEYNELHTLDMAALNFFTSGAEISMMYNNISSIIVKRVSFTKDEPNKIYVGRNPLACDCRSVGLKNYVNRSKQWQTGRPGPPFLLMTEQLRCAGPTALANEIFSSVSADQLVCPDPYNCPPGCNCTVQPSHRTLITTCSQLPSWTPNPLYNYSVSLRVERAGLRGLGNVSWSAGEVASLYLSHNSISELTPALLPAGLRELRVSHNNVSRVGEPFLERLDAASNNNTRLWLGSNPFVCDCELLPLHRYLQLHLSGNSLRIVDADQITCVGGEGNLVELTSAQLCSRTATIVAVCVVAAVVAIGFLVALCVYYRHGEMLKVWLYSHNLCLWFVTEEELDADKKYDAFISYSHLDEQFVVEKLVPELECGEPKYELCLHFRDWLAGEWITDQIQRSVQDSRRIIVIMSNNFIQSEWGRLEFLAAHKQALEDKRNRVIVIVYGELPDPATMDPELRLYISMNTYLEWGDAHFWQRLRYALPHKGRHLKRSHGRKTEKLGMVGLGNGTGLPATNGVSVPSTNGVHADAFDPSKMGNGDARQKVDQVV